MTTRRTWRRRLGTALTILLVASSSTALATPSVDSMDHIRFEVGDLPVRVLETRESELVVEFVERPGSRAEVPMDNVPGEVLYQVEEAERRPVDRDDWLQLAAFAARHDLHLRRLEALERAKELADDEQVRSRLESARTTCASDRLERARELRRAGDLAEAEHHLRQTVERYAECRAADRARDILTELDGGASEPRDGGGEGRRADPPVTGGSSEEAGSGRVSSLIETGREEIRAGQEASDDYVEATDHFEAALEALNEADELLDGETSSGSRGDDRNGRPSRQLVVEDLLVRAHVELGYVYLARGIDQDAYHHATLAAIVDPGSSRVSDLRQAIGANQG